MVMYKGMFLSIAFTILAVIKNAAFVDDEPSENPRCILLFLVFNRLLISGSVSFSSILLVIRVTVIQRHMPQSTATEAIYLLMGKNPN